MMNSSYFLGKWVLDPNQNNYETPTAPKEGWYTISRLETSEVPAVETLEFQMAWVDHNGQNQKARYCSVVDGQRHPYENPAIAEWIVTTLLSERLMETCTYKNDVLTSKGLRELSEDYKTMAVVQEAFLPTGEKIVNRSVYHAATLEETP